MEIGDITQLLLQNSLFDSLPDPTINEIAKQLSLVSFKLGDTVIRIGDPGKAFYIIADGKARMVDNATDEKPITLAILTIGDSFGEQPLLSRRSAETTVRAADNLTLLRLAAADFDRLVRKFPNFRKELEARVLQQTEFKFLRSLNFLSSLSLPETQKLLQAIETIHLKQGEFLFHEGAPADAAYIIRTGSIRLIKENAENTTLAILNTGDLCGDALLHSSLQSTSAFATEDTAIWRLSQAVFTQLTSNPKVGDRITQLAKNRSLQQQAILASRDTLYTTPQPLPPLQFRTLKVGKGLFARRIPFVGVETPLLAGIACLATINRFFSNSCQWSAPIGTSLRGLASFPSPSNCWV